MKKNLLSILAAVAMIGAMFTSCSKDEDVAAKAQPVDENNPVAVLNATFDEIDATLAQYDFHELVPLAQALQQTDKPSKGAISDWFVRGREKAAQRDSALRNRLVNFVNSLIPSYENPIHMYRAHGDKAESFFFAWELTAYMSGSVLNRFNYDTVFVTDENGSKYEIYLTRGNARELSLKERSVSASGLVILNIVKDGEELLSVSTVFTGSNVPSSNYNRNVVSSLICYNDMTVGLGIGRTNGEDIVTNVTVASGNTTVYTYRASITPTGTKNDMTYPTEFEMTLLPESRNVNFNGTINDMKTFIPMVKETREMMKTGATKDTCDALVAQLNDATDIYMSIASNGSDVTFDSQSFTVNEETVYQPVMMIKLANARYPMTLNRFFEGMGINVEEIFANLYITRG